MYRRGVLVSRVRTNVAGPARQIVARWLEMGRFDGALSRRLADVHARLARHAVARPLRVPMRADGASLFTITVGGATLGGSGRTRVALACAAELASRGVQVVLVGHAYGAKALAPRIVATSDALGIVGDEALACARALAAFPNARVVVGPTRQAAIDHAAALAPCVDAVVIDGPLQLAPERASLSILALDAEAPWGAGALPPAGDLRAPRDALLAHADHVVLVDTTPRGAAIDGNRVALAEIGAARLGIFTALARPERLLRALERSGIVAKTIVRAADHGPLTSILRGRVLDAPVDLWLATEKCATHLDAIEPRGRVAILDGSLVLPEVLRDALRGSVPSNDAIRIAGARRTCPHMRGLTPRSAKPYSPGNTRNFR